MRTYNLGFIGFGKAGRALAQLLRNKTDELRERYGIGWRLTGIATLRLGWLVNSHGLDLDILMQDVFDSPLNTAPQENNPRQSSVHDWLRLARPDVVFEMTTLAPHTGQPATEHLRAALEFGAHVVTANRGPVAYAYRALRDLAARQGKHFLCEAAVMDGVPVFSLFRENMPACNLSNFRGILNSAANFILTEMETGHSFAAAVVRAQTLGLTEADPGLDVDGWDAAVKLTVLANVLLEAELSPGEVMRRGIRGLAPEAVRAARAEGRPYKLICRAARNADGVTATVMPEQIPLTDPLSSVSGAALAIQFTTDTLTGLTLIEHEPGPPSTAYGLLADFIRAVSPAAA